MDRHDKSKFWSFAFYRAPNVVDPQWVRLVLGQHRKHPAETEADRQLHHSINRGTLYEETFISLFYRCNGDNVLLGTDPGGHAGPPQEGEEGPHSRRNGRGHGHPDTSSQVDPGAAPQGRIPNPDLFGG